MSANACFRQLSVSVKSGGVNAAFLRFSGCSRIRSLRFGLQDDTGDVASFMHRKTVFVCLTFAEVNYLTAYPARKGSGNHNHLSRNESVPGGTHVRKYMPWGTPASQGFQTGATFRTGLANCRNIPLAVKIARQSAHNNRNGRLPHG